MASKEQVILSHSGKQHSYHVAKTLLDLGYLKTFYTSSYITSPVLQGVIKKLGSHFWSRRFLEGLSGRFVNANWQYEIKEFIYRKTKGNSGKINELIFKRDKTFDRDLSRKLPSLQYRLFWGFQGSCKQCIDVANKSGKTSICEMTIAHVPFAKRLLNEEAMLYPEWKDSIDFANFPADYEQRLIEEPLHANYVIAISEFLKQTLVQEGVSSEKIHVIPLGFDANAIQFRKETTAITGRPLKLLYAGKITQRKGIQYLLDAIKQFNRNDVELHIIGNIHGKGEAFWKQRDLFNYQPGVSQQELFSLYSQYDILVFPSLLEGFGLVTVEAMGAGLPVITTPHTNATEVIKDGVNGFLVPIRNTEAIVNAINRFRNMDNISFQQMRYQARQTALQYTWEMYKEKVAQFISGFSL